MINELFIPFFVFRFGWQKLWKTKILRNSLFVFYILLFHFRLACLALQTENILQKITQPIFVSGNFNNQNEKRRMRWKAHKSINVCICQNMEGGASNGPAERERIRQEEAWFCSLVLVICNNHNFTRRRLVSKCTTILNCVIANEEASSVLAIIDLFSLLVLQHFLF